MALKPTIYKTELTLSDIDRQCYQQLNPVLALHPSETPERMMVRLLVYALNYHEQLSFGKGLSSIDEPDLWQCSLDGQVEHWFEMGQASPDRLRKAVSRAQQVSLYAYGSETDVWWKKNGDAIAALPKVAIWRFDWQETRQLPALCSRNMKLDMTVSDGIIYLSDGQQTLQLTVSRLNP